MMKRNYWFVVGVSFLIQQLAVADEPITTGFLNRSLTIGGEEYAYQVYIPADYSPATKWAVVVDLHGGGSGGRDGLRQTRNGLANAIRNHPDWLPIIGLFPQSPDSDEWKGFNAELVIAELDATLREYNGEHDRVYLTGLSMGGLGVYQLARDYPDRFAALVVSCSSPLRPPMVFKRAGLPDIDRSASGFASVAEEMPELPIWIFHGTEDDAVPFNEAQMMVAALEEVGREPRFTEYPGKDHRGGCGLPYLEEELWSWLLAIERASD